MVEYAVARSSSRMCAIFSASAGSWPSPPRGTPWSRRSACSASSTRDRDRGPRDPGQRREARHRILARSSSAGTARTRTALAAELLELEAEPLEIAARARAAPVARAGDSSISSGSSSRWLSSAPARQPFHNPLEQHALVRDVLVDDRDPLVVHRDDERVAELAERQSSGGVRCASASFGAGASGCAGFDQAAASHASSGIAYTPPLAVTTPGSASVVGRRPADGRGSVPETAQLSSGAARPSASPSARRITSWTSD